MCWKRPKAPKQQLMEGSFEFSEYARIPLPFCPGVSRGVLSLSRRFRSCITRFCKLPGRNGGGNTASGTRNTCYISYRCAVPSIFFNIHVLYLMWLFFFSISSESLCMGTYVHRDWYWMETCSHYIWTYS